MSLNNDFAYELSSPYFQQGLVGNYPKLIASADYASRIAQQDKSRSKILITGESGTGKEVLAKLIHRLSDRRDKPFVSANCAAFQDTLLESEVFGHERGAFTGAERQRIGLLEEAHGGTFFFDEIGTASPEMQAKLLRAFQDDLVVFKRVGGKQDITVDVRIITATNADLLAMIQEKKFRSDLYYRLETFCVNMPPLRDRGDDIILLAQYFMRRLVEERQTPVPKLAMNVVDTMKRYQWPGNVRQLESAIKRVMMLFSTKEVLTLEDFALAQFDFQGDMASVSDPSPASLSQKVSLKEFGRQASENAEKDLVIAMLEETKWNRKEAARRLGICYKALRNKLKKWNLTQRSAQPSRSRTFAFSQPAVADIPPVRSSVIPAEEGGQDAERVAAVAN